MRLVRRSTAYGDALAAVLVAALTSARGCEAYLYRNKTGHPDYHIVNYKAVSHCQYSVIVPGAPTCEQAAQYLDLSLSVFKNLNSGLDCSTYIPANTLICVPTNPNPGVDDGSMDSSTDTTATAAVASPTATESSAVNGTQTTTNGTATSSTVLTVTTVAAQAAATTTNGASSSSSSSPSIDESSCLSLFDYARSVYVVNQDMLTWSDNLAGLAQYSADYSASNNCCDETCHTLSGGDTGIAQNLFCGVLSCADAYSGWVTDEAASWGGHFANIVGYPTDYPYMGCAVSYEGVGAIVCNFSWYP